LIINAGIRGDWFIPSEPTNSKAWKESWEQATGLKADWPGIQYQIDPRFGISFPISVKTVLYFSYGHFNKLPQIDQYITDPYSGSGQNFTGNPHLDFIKTVKYEFGFTNQFAQNWAIDIKNFIKETSGEIGTTQIMAQYGLPLYLYDNKGYSRARGLEFELRKQQSNYYGGRLTYTLLWASGYSSSAFDDYKRSLTNLPNPIRESRRNWDLRHQIILRANLGAKKNQHPNLFGLKLPDDWTISLLTQIQSGQPYTPGTHNLIEEQKLSNTEVGPWHYRSDMKIEKNLTYENLKMIIGVDIDNIFNQYNIYVRRGFNVWAGEPYTYGQVIEDSREYWNYRQMYRQLQPDRFREGRHLEFVFQVAW
jgi:outer membrane receptor protein involved in Fe transport